MLVAKISYPKFSQSHHTALLLFGAPHCAFTKCAHWWIGLFPLSEDTGLDQYASFIQFGEITQKPQTHKI